MTDYRPGNIALRRPTDWLGRAVSAFSLSRYCHIRLITNDKGGVLEANPDGADPGTVQAGDVIVTVPLTDEQRAKIPALANAAQGTPYNFLDIAALALAALGFKFKWLADRIQRSDRLICSQLVDVVWQAAGFHAFNDGRLSQDVTPGDIADLAFTSGWKTETI